jgi:hypothetical protein
VLGPDLVLSISWNNSQAHSIRETLKILYDTSLMDIDASEVLPVCTAKEGSVVPSSYD